MRLRFVVAAGLIGALLLVVACTGPGGPAAPAAPGGAETTAPLAGATPAGPGGGRGANATPGGQRPGGGAGGPGGAAQRTPQAALATPAPAGSAPTQVGSALPTAVPIPVIPIPTLRAPRTVVPATPAPTDAPARVPTRVAAQQPTATAAAVSREALRGKIIFFSDRDGYPQLYVMEPDGSNQRLCRCTEALEGLVDQEITSPDGSQYLFVKQMGGRAGDYQIWAHRNATNDNVPVTGGPPGFPGVDYDPAWSPNARYIAWVTEINGFDEIYLHDLVENSDVRLTQSSKEWYKRPTFSPDGSQIAFWTNKEQAERKQIWVMNLDGSGAHNISQSQSNDYDPLWVK